MISPPSLKESEFIRFTIGGPVNNAHGEVVELSAENPEELIENLAEYLNHLQGVERWFCPAVLKDNYRKDANWRSAQIAAADIDYHDEDGKHCNLPKELRGKIKECSSRLPGQLMYHTPRGFRIIYVFNHFVDDRDQMLRILEEIQQDVADALLNLGLEGLRVDPVTKRLTQLMFAPRATVKGHERLETVNV